MGKESYGHLTGISRRWICILASPQVIQKILHQIFIHSKVYEGTTSDEVCKGWNFDKLLGKTDHSYATLSHRVRRQGGQRAVPIDSYYSIWSLVWSPQIMGQGMSGPPCHRIFPMEDPVP